MTEITKPGHDFIGYEYKELFVSEESLSIYIDCYRNFGWIRDENFVDEKGRGRVKLKLKRDRRMVNKVELTRLQKKFEADMDEVKALENAKTTSATIRSIFTGLVGTAFVAGSVFAVTSDIPNIPLTIIFGIIGFLFWGVSYFLYTWMVARKTTQLAPIIEEKYDEIYEVCEKGSKLLNRITE